MRATPTATAGGAAGDRLAACIGAVLLVVTAALAAGQALRTVPSAAATVATDAALPVMWAPGAGADREAALRQQLEHNPRDGRAWVLLAMLAFEADRYDAAARAFERAVAVSSKVAADPAVWCEYADALGMTQGGSLSGRPTELIGRALSLRANHPKALEMAGSAAYERRDFARAGAYWRQLLPQLDEGSEPQQQLIAAIARAERLATRPAP